MRVKSIYEGCKQVKWTKKFKAGYILQRELVGNVWMTVAYNHDGDYIGNSKTAHFLCVKKGILPEKAHKKDRVCSIGFCKKEQKWYGWSHRAIFGFKVGDKIQYNPDLVILSHGWLEGCMAYEKEKQDIEIVRGWFKNGWLHIDSEEKAKFLACRFAEAVG